MAFREVLIDVYCPKQVTIEAMPIKDGFDVLVKATKKFAIANGKKEYFLKEQEETVAN